jgi:ERCC4-type nuclease
MNHFEIDDCLESMQIVVDTREQPSKRAQRRYESFCVPYRRQTLSYGDYTYNFCLPSGEMLFGDSETIKGHVVVERKQDLVELSQCFCQSRERFEREFQRAKENGATVYLLVEDANWENLINGKYATRFNSKAFFASITAWMARYDIKIIFCKSETSGKMIKEILYRELKERLQRGEYDGVYQTG